MRQPPFQTTALVRALASAGAAGKQHEGPACSQAVAAQVRDECMDGEVAVSSKKEKPLRRIRLADLDSHMDCSIIGTCLAPGELRKLVAKFKNFGDRVPSDLEVHHAAVELSVQGGAGAKALSKLLDDRHTHAIELFRRVKSGSDLSAMWSQAMKAGEIPGAYWAVMTHPCATTELRARVFGDVHMLSHLVGAANRADIRRLMEFERENRELKEKIDRQQSRLQQMGVAYQESMRCLANRNFDGNSHFRDKDAGNKDHLGAEVTRLRETIRTKEQQVALHTSRREEAERSVAVHEEQSRHVQVKYEAAMALVQELQAEVRALEHQLQGNEPVGGDAGGLGVVAGRRVLYVGGRPSTTSTIRQLCDRAGIALTVHDGGIEDRKGLLAAAVPGADLVLFPVDCIDHDSVGTLKRLCQRHGVTYLPLRSAGVASFVCALTRHAVEATSNSAPSTSRFCLRHG